MLYMENNIIMEWILVSDIIPVAWQCPIVNIECSKSVSGRTERTKIK